MITLGAWKSIRSATRKALIGLFGLGCAAPISAESTSIMFQRLQLMPNLVVTLFGEMEKLADYKEPASYPGVHLVGRSELEREACAGRPCWRVKAAYAREKGLLYIDNTLDPQANIVDRSILLHELVHHMQNLTQRYADLPQCKRTMLEEREAFEIQNAYLAQFSPRQFIPFLERLYQCEGNQ